MHTDQLITLLILGLLVCIGYFGVAYKINYEKYKLSGLLYLMLITSIALLSIFLLGSILHEKAILENQLKNKCPEYKKVENVYKIK